VRQVTTTVEHPYGGDSGARNVQSRTSVCALSERCADPAGWVSVRMLRSVKSSVRQACCAAAGPTEQAMGRLPVACKPNWGFQ
jgi:hypothetical protein